MCLPAVLLLVACAPQPAVVDRQAGGDASSVVQSTLGADESAAYFPYRDGNGWTFAGSENEVGRVVYLDTADASLHDSLFFR